MKILFVIDYYQPQLGYSEKYIVENLKKMGHQVWVLTSNYYFPFPNFSKTAGKILGKRKQKSGRKIEKGAVVIREPLKFELFARAFFKNQEKYIKEINPDVVISNKVAGYNTIRFSQLKSKYGYRLISYDSHLPSEFYREKVWIKKTIYTLFKLLFRGVLNKNVDKFIAVQEQTVNIMRDFYGVNKKIDFIPLGTDTKLFRYDQKSRGRIRSAYKIDDKSIVLIYTGKIIKAKGVDLLFQTFAILGERYKNINLLIVGDGEKDYIDLCMNYLTKKSQQKVILAGFQKNESLYKYYSAADVAVWPLQESTAMNDAAACSLPFIANNKIGTRLRISNKNALLYKQGSVKDLALKIEDLILNPKKRKLMGKRGRELAEKNLSWDAIAMQYLT